MCVCVYSWGGSGFGGGRGGGGGPPPLRTRHQTKKIYRKDLANPALQALSASFQLLTHIPLTLDPETHKIFCFCGFCACSSASSTNTKTPKLTTW